MKRRSFNRALALSAAGLGAGMLPRWARSANAPDYVPSRSMPSNHYDIVLGRTPMSVGGVERAALTFNETVPGPLVHLREGEDVTLRVTNTLDEDSSIHWHGFLVPFEMDGVPGVSFPGIPAAETFTYRFKVKQHGTYWYHSHTRFQEQEGLYGPIIIDPAGDKRPYAYDRDVVVVLSDWPRSDPDFIYDRLKKMSSEYYNYYKRTFGDFVDDVASTGLLPTLRDRTAWAEMGMIPTDLLNVTNAGYVHALNGHAADANWTALFEPGERVRVRVINASAMTHYDVRVPGLPITMIQAHGQYIEPVETDEFRIGVAETYDFIVRPPDDRAYTIFAETLDRSGHARGTLAPRPGMEGPVPAPRVRPLRSLEQIGMGKMDDSLALSGGQKPMRNMPAMGDVNVAMRTMQPQHRLDDPGVGLGHDGRRVFTYAQMRALEPRYPREPQREIFLNLTSNMNRYIFSFDGVKFSDADRIQFYLGERLRLIMMNQTMMAHPIHLHGMWMELENGHGDLIPRVHTVMVKPGEKLSVLITPIELGDWAFHCHLLYHFHSGMFRVVNVALRPEDRREEPS
ncbi:MAG: copper resistance system multicopper oxidase [Geminicoccaceae bacterium]|nr:copper resistance system multicopper oxidase [Geminicoccaceae bacterium]